MPWQLSSGRWGASEATAARGREWASEADGFGRPLRRESIIMNSVETWVEVARLSKRVALRVLHNDSDAEEISQEVVALVLKNQDSIDDVKAYAATVAFRAAVRLSAKHTNEALIDPGSLPEPSSGKIESDVEQVVNRLFVEDLLSQLSPQQARALTARYLMDLPVDEVAARLGVSISTVKTHLKMGLRNLSRTLRRDAR
jgi:RNA polymerase sigma factor (sigma-70 family)